MLRLPIILFFIWFGTAHAGRVRMSLQTGPRIFPENSLFHRQASHQRRPGREAEITSSDPDFDLDGATPMSPLSPAYFAFAAIAITLYWACYRWKTPGSVSYCWQTSSSSPAWPGSTPQSCSCAATIDFLVGLGLQNSPANDPPLASPWSPSASY